MSAVHITKICRKCKIEKSAEDFHKSKINKDGLMSYCAKCRNDHAKAIRGTHPSIKADKERSDEIRAKERVRYHENHDKRRSYSNAWQLANQEKRKQYNKKYYERNKDKCLASAKSWKENNIERAREIKRIAQNKRWAMHHQANGTYTEKYIQELFEAQNKKCVICRKSISKKYHIDHIMPLSKGGSNEKSNIQLLCPSCNIRKGAKDPIEFMQSKGMLL